MSDEQRIFLTYEAVLEACALLVLDETATPITKHTLEEGDFGQCVQVELSPDETVVQSRLTLAAAIRSLTPDEARDILHANCFQREAGIQKGQST